MCVCGFQSRLRYDSLRSHVLLHAEQCAENPGTRRNLRGRLSSASGAYPGAYLDPVNARVEPADFSYLLRLAEALNNTLDLRTLLKRTSELVRIVIPYRIFAILLLDESGKELRMRYQIGHSARWSAPRFPSARAS